MRKKWIWATLVCTLGPHNIVPLSGKNDVSSDSGNNWGLYETPTCKSIAWLHYLICHALNFTWFAQFRLNEDEATACPMWADTISLSLTLMYVLVETVLSWCSHQGWGYNRKQESIQAWSSKLRRHKEKFEVYFRAAQGPSFSACNQQRKYYAV